MAATLSVTSGFRTTIAGSGVRGDFNGDSTIDLVVQNQTTGERAIWLMSGTTRSSVITLPTGVTAWQIATAGDLNGDCKPDLIFENSATGAHSVWFMDGTTRTSVANLPTVSTAWKVTTH